MDITGHILQMTGLDGLESRCTKNVESLLVLRNGSWTRVHLNGR